MKRTFDLAASLVALVVLAPVLLACALAVKLTSRGPVFRVSDRIGANNTRFNRLTFRTMRTDAPKPAPHLVADSTPVGGFLRRTRLDGLPQLVNVARGEMSIVGPRPALVNQHDQVALRTASGAHALRPGITGWAQVNGRDGMPVARKVELDAWYLEHRSFPLDMKIIWLAFRKPAVSAIHPAGSPVAGRTRSVDARGAALGVAREPENQPVLSMRVYAD